MDRVGAAIGDRERQDLGAEEPLLQPADDAGGAVRLGPDDDRRARARERHPGGAVDGPLAQLREERRVGEPVGLVQEVVEGGCEEARRRRRDRGAEQRRLRGCSRGLFVATRTRAAAQRDASVLTRRSGTTTIAASGSVDGDPLRRARAPPLRQIRQTPPLERRGEVVGVPFERQAELEQLVEGRVAAGRGQRRRRARRRSSPRTSRARARAGCG